MNFMEPFEKSFLNSKFLNINYLNYGNDRQKLLYEEITKLRLIESFSIFNPIIVGTIPIEIDIPSSDVDIIIDLSKGDILIYFKEFAKNFRNFILEIKINKISENSFIAQFQTENFKFEIFGEFKETSKQFGFVHMVIENEILNLLGQDFKNSIKKLKYKGFKTELAFCVLLNINEDPYGFLYNLKNLKMNDFSKEINKIYQRARYG